MKFLGLLAKEPPIKVGTSEPFNLNKTVTNNVNRALKRPIY